MSETGQPEISPRDEERIRLAIAETLLSRPPTIGVVGVSGTGKSSTLNAMFKTDLPVSHVVACTKEFRDVDLSVQVTAGHGAGERAVLRVVDAPGLGEDISQDPEYLAMYLSNLGHCDVVLWVLTARNRDVGLGPGQEHLAFDLPVAGNADDPELERRLQSLSRISCPCKRGQALAGGEDDTP